MLLNAFLFFLPLVLYILYVSSFTWLFGFYFHVKIIAVVLILLFLVAIAIDKRFRIRTKSYVLLVAGLFILFVAIASPIKNFLVKKSDEQLLLFAKTIEEYKLLYGSYPVDLSNDFFAELPTRSYVGTHFFYEKASNEKAYIRFYSFNGYWHGYDISGKRHYAYD